MGLKHIDYIKPNIVININGEQFGGLLKMGDIIATLNVLQYMRNINNNQSIKFYIPDSALQKDVDYVKEFKDFLVGYSEYLSKTKGDYDFDGFVELWGFRELNGEYVKIKNDIQLKKKICIFPLFDASYNTERNWSNALFQQIIDIFSTNEFLEYEKIICIKDAIPPNINIKNFKISTNFLENIYHLIECEYYVGGDTGMSHFVSVLNNQQRKKYYYYYNGNHGGWRSIFTSPFYINDNGKLFLYRKEEEINIEEYKNNNFNIIDTFSFFNNNLPYLQQSKPCDGYTHMGERTVEIPIYNLWINEHNLEDIIEVGAVTPIFTRNNKLGTPFFHENPYFGSNFVRHAVLDLWDDYSECIREDCEFYSYVNKYVMSCSTLEHIGMPDYGNKNIDIHKAERVLNKIMAESKGYLINFPIGYNHNLDNAIRKKIETGDENFSWFFLKQINSDNRWIVCDVDWSISYGNPFPWANGIIFITNNLNWINKI